MRKPAKASESGKNGLAVFYDHEKHDETCCDFTLFTIRHCDLSSQMSSSQPCDMTISRTWRKQIQTAYAVLRAKGVGSILRILQRYALRSFSATSATIARVSGLAQHQNSHQICISKRCRKPQVRSSTMTIEEFFYLSMVLTPAAG